MDFMQGRGSCYEEVEEVGMTGGDIGSKLPLDSSSSSPSSSQYKGHHVFGVSSSPWGGDRAVYYDQGSLNFHQSIEFNNLRSNQKNTNDEGIQGEAPPSGSGGGGDDQAVCIEREHMFDKVVTPSDVGKLNRLVIPKQHAEKYFPLDSSANEKGLLLSFEDRSGKPWRFRYSYWNSSQSYVMTKGWSRFVKEKKLYAGDIVSFERGAGESGKDRLYIDWRRRADVQDHHHQRAPLPSLPVPYPLSLPRTVPWGRLVYPPTMNYDHSSHLRRTNYDQGGASAAAYGYNYNVVNPGSGSVIYLSSPASQQQFGMVQHGGGGDVPMVFDSVPIVHGNKAASKRLRLFGVNLECPTSEEDLECDMPTSMPNPTIGSIYPQLPQLPSPPLQLRLFNGAPSPRAQSSSPTNTKQSMSLDLDI